METPTMPAATTTDPTTLPDQPLAPVATTSAAVDLGTMNGLWTDLAAGTITLPDLLTRLAEMQAAFLGS